jgi:hypothetical protein
MNAFIDYSSIKATIKSIIDANLQKHGVTWEQMLYGEITTKLQNCLRDIVNTSYLTSPIFLAAYTNMKYGRAESLLNTRIKISMYE